MFDDFCSECEFRQGPPMPPMGQGGCGGQFPMQGTVGMPPMQQGGMGAMQGPGTMPMMPGPMMPGQQMTGNIYQQPPLSSPMGMPSQTSGAIPQSSQGMMGQSPGPMGPSPVPGATFSEAPGAPVYQDTRYMQGYLRTLLGRYMRVEFLIGTNQLTDREGVLLDVGISYIVLREAQTDDQVMCDVFSIKFVTVFF